MGAALPVNVKPKIRNKKDLYDEIKSAKETGRNFYIGQAKVTWIHGSAIDAMHECEGRIFYGDGLWSESTHPADTKAVDYELKLVKVFCSRPLNAKRADHLYHKLVSTYLKERLCVNNSSADMKPGTEKGIVYLRIYEHELWRKYMTRERRFKLKET